MFARILSSSRQNAIYLILSECAQSLGVNAAERADQQYEPHHRFVIRRFDDSVGKPPGSYHHTGLTFALDLPHVADPAAALADMVSIAASMAEKLGGELVDDNRRPLTEAGVASIRRTLEKVVQDMEAHGVTPGSALARRLFS